MCITISRLRWNNPCRPGHARGFPFACRQWSLPRGPKSLVPPRSPTAIVDAIAAATVAPGSGLVEGPDLRAPARGQPGCRCGEALKMLEAAGQSWSPAHTRRGGPVDVRRGQDRPDLQDPRRARAPALPEGPIRQFRAPGRKRLSRCWRDLNRQAAARRRRTRTWVETRQGRFSSSIARSASPPDNDIVLSPRCGRRWRRHVHDRLRKRRSANGAGTDRGLAQQGTARSCGLAAQGAG